MCPFEGRAQEERAVRVDAIDQLVVTGQDLKSGVVGGAIYNGTSFTLRTAVFRVIAFQSDGSPRSDRHFRVSIDIAPMAAGSFSIALGDAQAATPTCGIVEATGIAPGEPTSSISRSVDSSSGPRNLTHDDFKESFSALSSAPLLG